MNDEYILREFIGSKLVYEKSFRAPSINSAKMKARKLLYSFDTDCFVFTGGKSVLMKPSGKDSRFKSV